MFPPCDPRNGKDYSQICFLMGVARKENSAFVVVCFRDFLFEDAFLCGASAVDVVGGVVIL